MGQGLHAVTAGPTVHGTWPAAGHVVLGLAGKAPSPGVGGRLGHGYDGAGRLLQVEVAGRGSCTVGVWDVGREGQGVPTYLVHVQAAECYVGGRLRAVGRVGKGLLRGGGGMGLGGLPGWASGLSRLDGAGRGVLGMEAAKQVQLGPGCM